MSKPLIDIKNLNKRFVISKGLFNRKKQYVNAINNFNFQIREGEVVGLIGESGSGKTTLARVLLGLTHAYSGDAIIDDIDMTKATKLEKRLIRSKIAVVFQDPASNLNPRQTVESAIMRPMLINGVSKEEAKKRAFDALVKVKMDTNYLNSYPHQLSGGQQQRIAIARALVLKPKIMILDEPTSALDISVQAQVLNLLLDLQEELKLTYLIVTHDLNVVQYISDRVAVMCLGNLVEYGSTAQVIDTPQHPYTKTLIASVPIMNPDIKKTVKKVFEGEIKGAIGQELGCKLYNRCSERTDQCKVLEPVLTEVAPGHFSACFHMHQVN